MRRMPPIPHHRRDEPLGVRRAALGIRAERTKSMIAVTPGRATSGLPSPFILRVERGPRSS
jgi:hypothetical protein